MGAIETKGRHYRDGNGEIRHMRGMRPSRPEQPGQHAMLSPMAGATFAVALFLMEMDHVRLRDQKSLGCCVGATAAEAHDQRLAREGKLSDDNSASMLDAYDVARIAGGTPLDEDSGSTSSDMCDGWREYGVATEKLRPFSDDPAVWGADRSPQVVADASARKLDLDLVCPTPASIKHALSQGFSVMTGFTCYEGIMSPAAAGTGEIPMPEKGESPIGGHEMLICGWDDNHVIGRHKGVWILRNHWNTWGARYGHIKGYGLLPFEYQHQGLMGDSRCPRLFETPGV